jgi:glucosylceramidase
MKKNNIMIKILLILLTLQACDSNEMPYYPPPVAATVPVDFYLTSPDRSNLVTLQQSGITALTQNQNFTINVNPNTTYQSMDGFGFSLTGGSAFHINNMSALARSTLLNDLFSPNGIHSSYLRISIGASDLDATVFSYSNLPAGQTDLNLNNFSLAPDLTHLIPVLNEIIAINPSIKIMATPWSAPTWMKTNQSSVGGELNPQFYGVYANYFVKYVQEMALNGITIDAITVQNEPENPFNNPSMVMTAAQQIDFIANHLGPAFANANITTKIVAFGHNPDSYNYPITVLNNPVARNFIAGSSFHLYAGQISNLSLVHNAHPDKNIYFSEQWIESPGDFPSDLRWHTRELIVGATRNWSRTVLEWNLAADSNNAPFTPGGCTKCLGAVTINGNTVEKNSAYYIIALASKFVKPGSVRIESNFASQLPNVAFKTPNGEIVVIVLNNTDAQQNFNINVAANPVSTRLPAGAVGTFVWTQN